MILLDNSLLIVYIPNKDYEHLQTRSEDNKESVADFVRRLITYNHHQYIDSSKDKKNQIELDSSVNDTTRHGRGWTL